MESDGKFSAVLRGSELGDFAAFGLDRPWPGWREPNWALPVLDLGPGSKYIPGAQRLDWPNWDADRDLLSGYADGSVGGIFAVNILEHLADPRPLIFEFARVLAPGSPASIFVPHARSGMYLQDLDHKTPFILDSWKNLLEPHPYYEKGHPQKGHGLQIGANFLFGVKEENLAVITQLIKEGDDEWLAAGF